MPLIVLGLICLICLIVYAVIRYMQGDDDDTPVRERYPDSFRKDESPDSDADNNTLMFPVDNVETEKHKRNIH